MHFFVLKIWSNQKNSRRFLQKADYNYTAGLWECLSLLPEHRTSQCTSLSQDPLLGFKHGESRSYFPKKGMEASFSLPIKCMERSLKRANSCSNHKNERKYRKIKHQKILLIEGLTFQIQVFFPFMYHHVFCYDPKWIITLSLLSLPAAPEENSPAKSLCRAFAWIWHSSCTCPVPRPRLTLKGEQMDGDRLSAGLLPPSHEISRCYCSD